MFEFRDGVFRSTGNVEGYIIYSAVIKLDDCNEDSLFELASGIDAPLSYSITPYESCTYSSNDMFVRPIRTCHSNCGILIESSDHIDPTILTNIANNLIIIKEDKLANITQGVKINDEEKVMISAKDRDKSLMAPAFNTLGLQNNATKAEIVARVRKLSLLYHPDKVGGSMETQIKINTAKAALFSLFEYQSITVTLDITQSCFYDTVYYNFDASGSGEVYFDRNPYMKNFQSARTQAGTQASTSGSTDGTTVSANAPPTTATATPTLTTDAPATLYLLLMFLIQHMRY